jgi:hypothetical protein
MIRTALIALISTLSIGTGSAALAAQLDADGNPVPGTLVNRPATDIERSYAGPYRQSAPIPLRDPAFFDRHSQVD